MSSVAVGIFCKTPAAGFSKTRLSPPLRPEDCSAISACFIRDLAHTIHSLGAEEGFTDGSGYWLVALVRALVGDVPGLTIAYLIAGLALMAWLALRALSRTNSTPQDTLWDIGALLMAALFLLSPNYPWYVLAAVPFIVLGGGAPAWAMTLGAILLYKPGMLPDNDLAWKTIATLPFVIAVAAHLLPGASIIARLWSGRA